MAHITFVFPRFKYPSGDFSLGLAALSAYIKRELPETRVSLIDASFSPRFDHVRAELQRLNPDIVGIYMDTLMLGDALQVAVQARALGCYVVAGGPHPTILPETVIEHDAVDAICIGEGEETITELIAEFDGGRRFERVAGLWHKARGVIKRNPVRPPIADVDSLPFPDVGLFDAENYISNFIQLDSYNPNLRGLSVIVSRGCPFTCSYCQPTLNAIFGKRFRIRSPEHVAAELKQLKERYSLDAVYFQDDTLTVSRKWVMGFCDLLERERLGITWACNTRADVIDREMLSRMKAAGLVKVKVGVEAFCDRIRNEIYNKGITLEQVNQLVDTASDLGVQVAGFFMLGAPTETATDIRNTIRFAAGSGLKEANFSVTVPLPKTSLHQMAREKGWQIPEQYSDFDYYHAVRPPMATDDVSPEKLERYKQWAYLSFYLHPKRLLHTFRIVFGFRSFKKAILKLKRF